MVKNGFLHCHTMFSLFDSAVTPDELVKRAKELGDYLIVGVTTEHFDESRGKVNVVDSVLERVENVRKTGFADEIILEDHIGQKIEDIQKYQILTGLGHLIIFVSFAR